MTLSFIPMPGETARHFRDGGADAYGNAPERHVSDGDGVPCRRCLRPVPEGAPYLLVAWRPFKATHAFAETGPVFLHAEPCAPGAESGDLPKILDSQDYILRGYDADERIVYGTGGVIARERIGERAGELLDDPRVAAVHIRSARNNCYMCRAVDAGRRSP